MPLNNNYRSVYEYDSKGNVKRITAFVGTDTTYKSTFGNYDDKPNLYAALKGLNAPDEVTELDGLGKIMKNNPGTVKHIAYNYLSGGVVQYITDVNDSYTYTYNEQNLPASFTVKNKNGIEYRVNITYACQ